MPAFLLPPRRAAPWVRPPPLSLEAGAFLHPAAEVDLRGTAFGEVGRVGVAAVDIAGIVGSDAFERAKLLGLRNEGRDLAVLDVADPDALHEARGGLLGRCRVGDIDVVVLVDVDAARPAALLPFGEVAPLLVEDLDA